MRVLGAAMLGVVMVACAGTARAQDDNAKKIVGTWEVTKSAGELPVGATIEFTKDMKLTLLAKQDGAEIKFEGSYKLEKDKLMVKVKVGGDTIEESATIKKLTDDALEIEDKDKKVDVFKRVKDKK